MGLFFTITEKVLAGVTVAFGAKIIHGLVSGRKGAVKQNKNTAE
jgi:hypothetical protein